jgi:transcriptional regulator with XRE-family HTH domain
MEIRGDIVRQLRTERSWTQAHLAEVCEVNLRTIQRVENQGSASVETIMALCAAFDIKRDVLFKVPEPNEIEPDKFTLGRLHYLLFVAGLLIGLSVSVLLLMMK